MAQGTKKLRKVETKRDLTKVRRKKQAKTHGMSLITLWMCNKIQSFGFSFFSYLYGTLIVPYG